MKKLRLVILLVSILGGLVCCGFFSEVVSTMRTIYQLKKIVTGQSKMILNQVDMVKNQAKALTRLDKGLDIWRVEGRVLDMKKITQQGLKVGSEPEEVEYDGEKDYQEEQLEWVSELEEPLEKNHKVREISLDTAGKENKLLNRLGELTRNSQGQVEVEQVNNQITSCVAGELGQVKTVLIGHMGAIGKVLKGLNKKEKLGIQLGKHFFSKGTGEGKVDLLIEGVTERFDSEIKKMESKIINLANDLAKALMVVYLIWVVISCILDRVGLVGMLMILTQALFNFSVVIFILEHSQEWYEKIVESFEYINMELLGGNSGESTSSQIAKSGIELSGLIFKKVLLRGLLFNFVAGTIGCLIAGATLILFLILSAECFLVFISMKVLGVIVIFCLAFAVTPWTKRYAWSYILAPIYIGVKAMVLTVVTKIISIELEGLIGYLHDKDFATMGVYAMVLYIVVVLFLLAIKLPKMIADVVVLGGGLEGKKSMRVGRGD